MENRKSFLERLYGHFSQTDIEMIELAYELSKSAHRNQKRMGGERYFEHPRAGSLILMDEVGLYDKDILIGILLHDVGEDSPLLGNRSISYKKFRKQAMFRLELIFGKRVADMVLKMTKPDIDEQVFKTKAEVNHFYLAELRKNEDAIILKMVDRLHNLRSMPDSKGFVKKQIKETEEVYLPIFSCVKGRYADVARKLLQKICEELEKLRADHKVSP